MPKKEIFRADYQAPAFLVDTIELDIDIRDSGVRVASTMQLRQNPTGDAKAPLVLAGLHQKLESVTLDGKKLTAKDYKLTDTDLTIPGVGKKATLVVVSSHDPAANTRLSGLYKSGPMLITQCEPEGFRSITYHPDRPDVMSVYRVTIHADRKKYPVLLANGNLVKAGKEGKDRHYTIWEDPFRKPSYLFAMVAGDLDRIASRYTTGSGRKILLEIFTEPGRTDETGVAMSTLKKSMKWDEDTFGLEYDLDRFMVVGTPFFNMGAMENKGLNIFNDSTLLGKPETATDDALRRIETVVCHEYFHNWSGNRITCRDWFQLSLKEGLTVYREQEYCSDVNSRAVERIKNVRFLRAIQFPEDGGAMAHPVRPESYQEIDNFYTMTVYEKGSEVVRMIRTLAGAKGFRRGMDLYVKRHDGSAATCDDFVKAMADANKLDLSQFMLWYSQAGTPTLKVRSKYDAKAKQLVLDVSQKTPVTRDKNGRSKKPMLVPLAIGLLDAEGRDMIGTQVLKVTKATEQFTLKNIKKKPYLSLLRDFSAPVNLDYPSSDEELMFLWAHDSDPFNRWEAGYKLLTQHILARMAGDEADAAPLIDVFRKMLRDKMLDPEFKSLLLSLPSERELAVSQQLLGQPIDVDGIAAARLAFMRELGEALQADFEKLYNANANLRPTAIDGKSVGRRQLKNQALAYLAVSDDPAALKLAYEQVANDINMSDQAAGLAVLVRSQHRIGQKGVAAFAKRWGKTPGVMDTWLTAQAVARRPDALKQVKALLSHPVFDIRNPNRVRALVRAFTGNAPAFHKMDGSGYRFIADMILKIDPLNGASAAALAKAFADWRDYSPARQKLIQAQLQRLAKHKLSPNTSEIITKSLAA